jgi:two-component system NtrC family response regulator
LPLDEIGEVPLSLQSKLLRALQERVVDVVGGDAPIGVDVRVLAATNKNLQERIREGKFREDLYYRLNVVELHVPSLRERPEDIPLLVEYFIREMDVGREMAVPPPVMEELKSRSWAGNVRELRNACERIVILSNGREVAIDDLPAATAGGRAEKNVPGAMGPEWPPLPPEGLSLIDLEKKVIEMALRLKNGNITQAAAYLRIPRHILVYRIEKYGLPRHA